MLRSWPPSTSTVNTSVLRPRRAAVRPAAKPAMPAPITATSNDCSTISRSVNLLQCLDRRTAARQDLPSRDNHQDRYAGNVGIDVRLDQQEAAADQQHALRVG